MTSLTKIAATVATVTAGIIKVAQAIHTVALTLSVKATVLAASSADTKVNAAIRAENETLAANQRRLIAANQAVEDSIGKSIAADAQRKAAEEALAAHAG